MNGRITTILETPEFIAISKPAGVLVHAPRLSGRESSRSTPEAPTVVEWIRKRYPEILTVGDEPKERPGIVHRLDKDTSGVLVIARTQPFFDHLKALFQKHTVEKTYTALVWGRTPKRGVIDKPIGLKPGTVKHSTIARHMKMIKTAVTEYETEWTREYKGEEYSLVRLTPKTGRTHQLRVHMASQGHPIVGDSLYSRRKDPWELGRQFLHAGSIEFSMPGRKRVRLSSGLPPQLMAVIKKINPNTSD
jgi:23S rRNA pseudouridine1911/1915/1917 synthase